MIVKQTTDAVEMADSYLFLCQYLCQETEEEEKEEEEDDEEEV